MSDNPCACADEKIPVVTDEKEVLTVIQDQIFDVETETVLTEEQPLVVQDAPDGAILVPKYLSQEEVLTLVDAGPVFRGPRGLNNFELWKLAGHTGTLNDFLLWMRGDPGPVSTSKTFTFIQTEYTYVWTITHDLNKIPDVILIDSAGDQFDATIQYPDLNTVIVTTIAPTLGTAFLQ